MQEHPKRIRKLLLERAAEAPALGRLQTFAKRGVASSISPMAARRRSMERLRGSRSQLRCWFNTAVSGAGSAAAMHTLSASRKADRFLSALRFSRMPFSRFLTGRFRSSELGPLSIPCGGSLQAFGTQLGVSVDMCGDFGALEDGHIVFGEEEERAACSRISLMRVW